MNDAERKLEEFLSWTERRGRKHKTITTYRSAIQNMIRFWNENGMESDPERIGEYELRFLVNNYLASENTIRHYIKCLGVWLSYCHNTALDEIGLLWNENGCPNALWIDEYEFQRMLSVAKDPTERIVLILGARCGLRCSEISGLNKNDFNGKDLIVRGKGHGKGKIRILPLSRAVVNEITMYNRWRELQYDGRIVDDTEAMIVVNAWNDTHVRRLTPDHTYKYVKRVADRAGVACSTHSLRRLFATTLLTRGTDLTVLKVLLGHSNIQTTAKYIQTDMMKMQKAMELLDVF